MSEKKQDKPPATALAPVSKLRKYALDALLSPGVVRALQDQLRRAIQGHVGRIGREVESVIGACLGFILSAIAIALIAPSSSPLQGFMTLILTVVGWLVGGRLRLGEGPFTSKEELQNERDERLYNEAKSKLDVRAKELQDAGYTGREIETELGPFRRHVLQARLDAIYALKDGRSLLEREGLLKALGPGSADGPEALTLEDQAP